ncbi:MAG: cbb3-type cytochrome c oxidase subunit I, partial [Anaerolineales bacterium]|nr:cbb3-type cytochrome c oxidase subunit I [Anaerolineales bacterium]
NLVIHNTMWIPGHFHLTVGSGVTLTFFGIAYWLVPSLSGKPLWNRKVALVQTWTWFFGMLLMGNGLHILGLNFGMPRRTMIGAASYAADAWTPMLIEAAIGGIILGISGLLFYSNMVGTVFSKKRLEAPIEMPVAEPYESEPAPAWLDNWKPWLAVTVVLILVAYGPILVDMIANANMTSPGFKVW